MPKSSNTKDKIIAAAATLMNVKGFRATSVSDIIDAVGVTKGCFFHYFSEKESLGQEVLEHSSRAFLSFLDKSLVGATPMTALRNFFKAALTMHKKKGFIGGCLFGNLALEMADVHTSLSPTVSELFENWTTKLEKVITEGQNLKEIKSSISAHTLALMIISAIEGGIMLSRINKKSPPLAEILQSMEKLLCASH